MAPSLTRTPAARVAVGLAAGVNLTAAIVLALRDPRRANDLNAMYGWCRAWLFDGASLYTPADAATDYPPSAIVLLSPLALVPREWIVALWAAIGAALVVLLPWLAVRSATSDGSPRHILPMLFFLCWGCTRTLLQFTILSLVLGFVALGFRESRPVLSGVALGLALFKPHIAGAFAAWAVVARRWRMVLVAAAVVVACWMMYDARVRESPIRTLVGYAHTLGREYAGAEGLTGRTSLRAWAQAATSSAAAADASWAVTSAFLLACVIWLAAADGARPLESGGIAIVALLACASLLTVYHNSNNLVLLLPAFIFLWFHAPSRTSLGAVVALSLLQLALVLDLSARVTAAETGVWVHQAALQFDRVLVLGVFVWVAAEWRRLVRLRPVTGDDDRTADRE